ncbi:MAG: ribonuclease R, partial [Alphaproteobacteria bacterium]|nr:ribonuclease R [Alphaproteobacteria bacterium]
LGKRTDLRGIPLVTIDGADARDFDDAVFAEPDPDPKNPGGWHLMVAIADVAHYVRTGDALDKSAYERGNSVYFPDRVVPMLPEALSNELCSLRPHEDRACMAVHMWVDAHGKKLNHKFVRGLMRSTARLTYEQAQAAIDGHTDETTEPLVENVIRPLFTAYKALDQARRSRGTLELDLAERQVVLGADGTVASIRTRDRFDSHKLIEEFMILANVCAAETIESLRLPCMYRVHDEPDSEKLEGLREVLHGIELNLAKGQVMTPKHFNQILAKVRGGPNEQMVNQLVLRSQAQAVYSPENLGHFGLALQRYAHFTSPIRRYSDLLVHRALIRGLKLGTGALLDEELPRFVEMGEHISITERRAAHAERDAIDRFVTAFMADRVGAVFPGRINGVTRFGLFITLDETGADGFVPIRTLPNDYYDHDAVRHQLVGRSRGLTLTMGDRVEVRLAEADQVTGGLLFELMEGGTQGEVLSGRSAQRKMGFRQGPGQSPGKSRRPALPTSHRKGGKKPAKKGR